MKNRSAELFFDIALLLNKYSQDDISGLSAIVNSEREREKLLRVFRSILELRSEVAHISDRTAEVSKPKRKKPVKPTSTTRTKRSTQDKNVVRKQEIPSREYNNWARIIMGKRER